MYVARTAGSGLSAITAAATARASDVVTTVMDQISSVMAPAPEYQPLSTSDLYGSEMAEGNWSGTSSADGYDEYMPYSTPVKYTTSRRLPPIECELPADYLSITGTPYQALDAGFVNDTDIERAFEEMQTRWDTMFPNERSRNLFDMDEGI